MAFIVNKPSEALTADQVKQLPVGSKVTLHGCDRYGIHTQLECTIIQSGKAKKLSYRNTDGMPALKAIQNYPNKYYTEGGVHW